MADDDSITQWIQAVRSGDQLSADQLWNRYFGRLVRFARGRMCNLSSATYDEEDAAISTFRVMYEKLSCGGFEGISSRQDFWNLMLAVVIRKINRRTDYESAIKRRGSIGQIDLNSQVPIVDPCPSEVSEGFEYLLAKLGDPKLEQVALWKLDGFTNEEIANKLNRTRRTVQRMITLIQDLWREELNA